MIGTLARYLTRATGRGEHLAAAPADAAREYDVLLHTIADRLYRETLGRGGWATDIGCFGPDLFLDEASEHLRAIALGNVQSGPPTP